MQNDIQHIHVVNRADLTLHTSFLKYADTLLMQKKDLLNIHICLEEGAATLVSVAPLLPHVVVANDENLLMQLLPLAPFQALKVSCGGGAKYLI